MFMQSLIIFILSPSSQSIQHGHVLCFGYTSSPICATHIFLNLWPYSGDLPELLFFFSFGQERVDERVYFILKLQGLHSRMAEQELKREYRSRNQNTNHGVIVLIGSLLKSLQPFLFFFF